MSPRGAWSACFYGTDGVLPLFLRGRLRIRRVNAGACLMRTRWGSRLLFRESGGDESVCGVYCWFRLPLCRGLGSVSGGGCLSHGWHQRSYHHICVSGDCFCQSLYLFPCRDLDPDRGGYDGMTVSSLILVMYPAFARTLISYISPHPLAHPHACGNDGGDALSFFLGLILLLSLEIDHGDDSGERTGASKESVIATWTMAD